MEHSKAMAVAGGVALLTLSGSLAISATQGLLGFTVPTQLGHVNSFVPASDRPSAAATRAPGYTTAANTGFAAAQTSMPDGAGLTAAGNGAAVGETAVATEAPPAAQAQPSAPPAALISAPANALVGQDSAPATAPAPDASPPAPQAQPSAPPAQSNPTPAPPAQSPPPCDPAAAQSGDPAAAQSGG